MPASTLSRVDLPVPLAPTSPARSFGVISQLRSSNRILGPKRFPAAESWIIESELHGEIAWNHFRIATVLIVSLIRAQPCVPVVRRVFRWRGQQRRPSAQYYPSTNACAQDGKKNKP